MSLKLKLMAGLGRRAENPDPPSQQSPLRIFFLEHIQVMTEKFPLLATIVPVIKNMSEDDIEEIATNIANFSREMEKVRNEDRGTSSQKE